MCTIIHHISSYIKGLLFLAIMVLNLGIHQVCAKPDFDISEIIDPTNPYKIESEEKFVEVFDAINYFFELNCSKKNKDR